MNHEEQPLRTDTGNTRRWRCPGHGDVMRVPEAEADPTLCDSCTTNNELHEKSKSHQRSSLELLVGYLSDLEVVYALNGWEIYRRQVLSPQYPNSDDLCVPLPSEPKADFIERDTALPSSLDRDKDRLSHNFAPRLDFLPA